MGFQILGGQYTATQDPDGSWTIHDVPVFAENSRELRISGKAREVKYDQDWLIEAVANARKQYARDGYLAPLHIDHHDEGRPTPKVGFILPTRVGPMSVEGETKSCVYADLLKIPPEVYARIRRYDLPYRSVETPLPGDGAPEITSLALLSDQVPFFRFPLLTVGREVKHPDVVLAGAGSNPVLAYALGRTHLASVTKFESESNVMPASAEVPAAADVVAPAPESPAVKFAEEEKKPEAEKPAEAPPAEEEKPEDEVEQKPGESPEMMMLRELLGLLKAMVGVTAPAAEGSADQGGLKPTPVGAPVAAFKAETSTTSASSLPHESVEIAKRDGEIVGLRAQIAKFKADQAKDVAIAAAAKRLEGYPIDDAASVCAAKYAAGGQSALDAFVEGVESAAVREPTKEWTAGEPHKVLPPEIAKFAAQGEAAVALAQEAAASFESLPGAFKRDKEGWIESFVKRGLTAPANGSK